MMYRALALVALAVCLPLAAFACGDSGTAPDATGVEMATPIASGEVPQGAPLIDQLDLKFIPNSVTMKLTDLLYLKNSESAIHTVTINGKNVTGNMDKDRLMAWVPPAVGTYKVTCDFHPQMKATIKVVE